MGDSKGNASSLNTATEKELVDIANQVRVHKLSHRSHWCRTLTLGCVDAQVALNKGTVIDMLLKSVTTVQ